ncbi:MAG: permease [Deltaproteobacteria bacterium]|nr:permease [Nannocystaceae bacterium]
MIGALLITLASVVIGAAIAVATSRGHALLEVLRSFAVAAVATLAAVQLLPEAVESLGAWALLLFVGALALPPSFAYLLRRAARDRRSWTSRGLGVELGYLGFVAHQLVEGLALGTYSGPLHADHDHVELVLAMAAHTVPLTALFIGRALLRGGPQPALRRVVALLVASAVGFAAAGLVNRRVTETIAPVLAAVVAGLLCHVLLHVHDAPAKRTVSVRAFELLAVIAGVALPMSAIHSHGGVPDQHEGLQQRLLDSWLELTLETAPMLLLGLVLGAALRTFGPRLPLRWVPSGSPSRQAGRGIAIAASLPLFSSGALPTALRQRGAGAALAVAFLISTPELGPQSFVLSVGFLGWPFTLLRLAAVLSVAYIAGLAFSRLVGRRGLVSEVPTTPHADIPALPETVRGLGGAAHHFDELLLRTAPWTLVGLLASAYITVAVPPDALAWLARSGLDIPVFALVALPTYVCPAAATPIAAVLLLKGISPGAVLVALMLGPATSVARLAFLGSAYGVRATLAGVGIIAVSSCLAGFATNVIGVPIELPPGLEGDRERHAAAWGCLATLVVALGWQLWRWGLAPWLRSLDAFAHGDHAYGPDDAGHHHHGNAVGGETTSSAGTQPSSMRP